MPCRDYPLTIEEELAIRKSEIADELVNQLIRLKNENNILTNILCQIGKDWEAQKKAHLPPDFVYWWDQHKKEDANK